MVEMMLVHCRRNAVNQLQQGRMHRTPNHVARPSKFWGISANVSLNVFQKLLLRVCIIIGHLFWTFVLDICFAIVLQLSIVLTIVLQLFEICAFLNNCFSIVLKMVFF